MHTRRLSLYFPAPILDGISFGKIHLSQKNLWLKDVWYAKEAIGNEEQDPEILQDITQQEPIRNFLGANIQPTQVAPLPEFSGVKQKQQRVLEFFFCRKMS